ncbi:hypothetical protein WK80_09415 [Burkholderia multivorans]|nr:hypothetical protein WK80_09415 [Burkholderia multivorans]
MRSFTVDRPRTPMPFAPRRMRSTAWRSRSRCAPRVASNDTHARAPSIADMYVPPSRRGSRPSRTPRTQL